MFTGGTDLDPWPCLAEAFFTLPYPHQQATYAWRCGTKKLTAADDPILLGALSSRTAELLASVAFLQMSVRRKQAVGSFCHLLRRNDRPPCSEGFLLEGVAHFLAKGSRKTPRKTSARCPVQPFSGGRRVLIHCLRGENRRCPSNHMRIQNPDNLNLSTWPYLCRGRARLSICGDTNMCVWLSTATL